jgi:phage tail protein X
MKERAEQGDTLDESVYSYYTEKTDLNEDVLAQSFNNGATPDKEGLATSQDNTGDILVKADLETSHRRMESGRKSQFSTVQDQEDGSFRRDTPPFDSHRSMEN